MTLQRRIAPALLLLVLAPLVAEFLLGDFAVRRLGLLVPFIPQYGGGALLIREVTRRTGRGWPSMLVLALAYALLEEGLTTQSLFNPDYAGQRLLDFGYVSALGISTNWTLFVLSIHVVWSVSTPILIAEGIAGDRRATPWLGRLGLGITAALFILGCAFITFISLRASPFRASPSQLIAAGSLAVVTLAAAFLLFAPAHSRLDRQRPAPAPWIVGVTSLLLATAFEVFEHGGRGVGLNATLTLAAMLACEAAAVVLIATWSHRAGWNGRHYLAIAAGTILTYGWVGLTAFFRGTTNIGEPTNGIDIGGQCLEIVALLALIAWGWQKAASA